MKPYHLFLAFLMLVTGSINTITTKYADITCAFGVAHYQRDDDPKNNPCPEADRGQHPFDHPFVQAMFMFLGEFACLLAFRLSLLIASCRGKAPPMELGHQKWSPMIFFIPALCDCTATSCMYVGLNLTYASSFQMLRGAVVIFTGLLSMVWLKRKLTLEHWTGMFLVLTGLVCVGLSAFLSGNSGAQAPNPLLGDAIIIGAQVIVALQMVVEEKFLGKHKVPALQAVGWEGVFGLIIISIICMVFYHIPGPRSGHFEDINDAMLQIKNSWQISLAISGTIVSIAFFNFSGISVTKEMNATTRMVLDSVRTMVIWAYSLGVGWESFQYLQVIGFVLLLSGTFVYNGVLIVPGLRAIGVLPKKVQVEEEKDLLSTNINSATDS